MALMLTEELVNAALEQMHVSVTVRRQDLALKSAGLKEKINALVIEGVEKTALTDNLGKKRTKDVIETLAEQDEEIKRLKWQKIQIDTEIDGIDENFKRAQMILGVYRSESKSGNSREFLS